MQQQSTCSQTMSCLKYLISVERITATLRPVWKWHTLVHVCQRWRQIVFASPRRLNLQILCTHGTPVRKNLGIWPAFPIAIDYYSIEKSGLTPTMKTMSLLHSSTPIVYVTSGFQRNGLAVGKDGHGDAGAISGADASLHFLEGWKCTGPSRRILGRICTMFTGNHLIRHSLSSITNTSFVGQ
jgi:hypothetical protein